MENKALDEAMEAVEAAYAAMKATSEWKAKDAAYAAMKATSEYKAWEKTDKANEEAWEALTEADKAKVWEAYKKADKALETYFEIYV